MPQQLTLRTIDRDAWKVERKRALQYIRDHAAVYRGFAENICPDLSEPEHIWRRVAFAILSSRERFPSGCSAYQILKGFGSSKLASLSPECLSASLKAAGIVYHRSKAQYLLEMTRAFLEHAGGPWLKRDMETWPAYAERLEAIPGLGITKARFLACLLYPMRADLACLDTWITKFFIRKGGIALSRTTYTRLERHLSHWGRVAGVSTFSAQWMVWDCVRGSRQDHSVLAEGGGIHG